MRYFSNPVPVFRYSPSILQEEGDFTESSSYFWSSSTSFLHNAEEGDSEDDQQGLHHEKYDEEWSVTYMETVFSHISKEYIPSMVNYCVLETKDSEVCGQILIMDE
ncbi:unnamed protein product [Moneuplotes crassus]|uniref:Uncharacterized protein n=1 Tax=Euplotes crassus TaxID=5936 RepID=A0AAD1U5E7_EUPCR|nr:unnamed protein product [Moneuplotes crassus]